MSPDMLTTNDPQLVEFRDQLGRYCAGKDAGKDVSLIGYRLAADFGHICQAYLNGTLTRADMEWAEQMLEAAGIKVDPSGLFNKRRQV